MADRQDDVRSIAEIWAEIECDEQRALVTAFGEENAAALLDGMGSLRLSQLPPPGDWTIWAILAGRGFGKTRAGAEWVHMLAADRPRRFALVGTSLESARAVMVG